MESALPEAVFRDHQQAGPLFSSAIVEVV